MDIDTGVTVIVDLVPLAVAVTAAPTKFNLDTVFAVPTNVPSSNIVIPFTNVAGVSSCQYLSYVFPFGTGINL